MYFDAEEHVIYRIANAPLQSYPFPHFYAENVFPTPMYAMLRERLRDVGSFKRLDETGTVPKGAYPERFVCDLAELEEREIDANATSFWGPLGDWILGDRFENAVVDKFRDGVERRFGRGVQLRTSRDCRMVRDISNYSISPHTDAPRKLVSLLFYLPDTAERKHLGTSIYAPIDPSFRCEGRGHHPFEKFRKVVTMEYRPNTLFAFLKTDQAFHGVDRIEDADVVRDSMLYNVYVEKTVVPQPAAAESAEAGRMGLGKLFARR
jgi:hypothetical protein